MLKLLLSSLIYSLILHTQLVCKTVNREKHFFNLSYVAYNNTRNVSCLYNMCVLVTVF
jgi:hypothetical protein